MKEKKLIVRVHYSLIGNTIKYAKKGYTITEETPYSYYCKEIGETFYKKKEGQVTINSGYCLSDLVIWKSIDITNSPYSETYHIGYTNNLLRHSIIEYLQERINEIEII